jgi:hypothetical protein
MKKRLIATVGATAALAMLVPSVAYASTSTASQQTLAVQAGTLFVSNTTPANITAQVDGTGSGALPSAEWGDLTGSGDGWQGSIAASDFIYTGNWSPVGSAPALSSDTSAGYTGTADGDTYTVTITSVSGSTVDFTYSSTNGASGTGTATAGTAADVGTNGLTITFSAAATYATGDAYQIEVGSQNPSALVLNESSSSATITPYDNATSTSPAYVNATATVKGGGSTYGTAVPFLSAAQDTGMGEYTVSPQAKVTTDLNSWAATYTSNVQYTISSGPASGFDTIHSDPVLISSQTFNYTGGLQTVTVPSNAQYAVITETGAGGGGGSDDDNTYGGNGGAVKASAPVTGSSTLTVLVGGGGQTITDGSGGGGGLSGVFSGTPSQSTALVIAGGGGGGANDDSNDAQSNGTAGGFSPTLPTSPLYGSLGGAGYGGGGESDGNWSDTLDAPNGTPFGATAPSCVGYYSGQGGYGGGADGGCGWGGGGGGGGYLGGQGGSEGTSDGSGGEGGSSYTAAGVTVISASTGGGGAGGYGAAGSNGTVSIAFFS